MTRRTQFTGSAAGRRRERRAHLQSEVSVSSEVMHRPTPGRVVLHCQRRPTSRVFKATTDVNPYGKQINEAIALHEELRAKADVLKKRIYKAMPHGGTHIVRAVQK